MGDFGSSFNSGFSNMTRAIDAKKARELEALMQAFYRERDTRDFNYKKERDAESDRRWNQLRIDREIAQSKARRREQEAALDSELEGMLQSNRETSNRLAEVMREAKFGPMAEFSRENEDGSKVKWRQRYNPATAPQSAPGGGADDPNATILARLNAELAQARNTAADAKVKELEGGLLPMLHKAARFYPGTAALAWMKDTPGEKRTKAEELAAKLEREIGDLKGQSVPSGKIVVQNGKRYVFKGGDPNDPANYTPVTE